MTVEDLRTLFDYSYWANERVCDRLSQLTTEQFTQPVAGSYGSIRNTMVHMLSAEWGWLERCGGAPRGPALMAIEFSVGGGSRQSMALGQLLHHAAIHGVHHRGQVALLLRTLGRVPGNFDILLYYARR
jgi:uncharacterized damage-inducible protein DinB